jgi:hypothetical protein
MTGAASPAALYLERLQKARYVDAGLAPPEIPEPSGAPDDADAAALVRAYRERPTRYETPRLYLLLERLASRVEHAIPGTGWPTPPRPVLGTLPIGSFGAMILPVPGSEERVIAFQQGAFGFMNLVAKAVAMALPIDSMDPEHPWWAQMDRDRITGRLRGDEGAPPAFLDFLSAYTRAGDPNAARPYRLSGPMLRVVEELRLAGELFLLAHEYGHLIAGHLAAEQPDDPQPEHLLSRAWRHELDADTVGFLLTCRALALERGLDATVAWAGLELIVTTQMIVDRALDVLRHGAPNRSREAMESTYAPAQDDLRLVVITGDTHPTLPQRREALKTRMRPVFGDDAVEAASERATTIAWILERLWDEASLVFRTLHVAGVRPAAVWSLAGAA